ncbi:MAG: hypothetical protein ACJASM_000894 [Salibacteraceae bacterium]|jgi:hypothetical protein
MDFTLPTIDIVVEQGLSWTTLVGGFVASSFLGVKLGYEYFKYSVSSLQGNNPNVPWDWMEIQRVVVLLIILGAYSPIAEGFTMAMSTVNAITQKSDGVISDVDEAAVKWKNASADSDNQEKIKKLKRQIASEDEPAKKEYLEKMLKRREDGEDIKKKLGMNNDELNLSLFQMLNPANWVKLGLLKISEIFGSIVKAIVGFFFITIFKVAIIFGPIVIGFGVIFRDKPMQFLNQLLLIGLVFTTMNILDMLITNYIHATFTGEVSMYSVIAFNIGIIGCYLYVKKITTWFAGATGMDGIMGRGVGAVTTLAGGAMIGAGMAAKGGGALKNVGKTTLAAGNRSSKKD